MARINLTNLNNNPRRRTRRRGSTDLWSRIGLFLGGFLLITAIATIIIAHLPQLLIKNITVEDTTIIKAEDIQSVALKSLTGNYFFFIPRGHIWWYPKAKLKAKLLETFPRLESVGLYGEWDKGLTIQVSEREPALLYCQREVGNCYFIDKTGLIYAPAPHFSPGVFLEWQASNTPIKLPVSLTSSVQVERLLSLSKILNKVFSLLTLNKSKINSFESTPDGDFNFIVSSDHSWRVITDAETPALTLGDNFHTALLSILKEYGTTTLQKLEYVDLRFGKKVFYKL